MRRAAGLIGATILFACLQPACTGDAQSLASPSLHDAVAADARSTAALYHAIDDALSDAYLTGGLLDPSVHPGAAEPCVKTDNGVGSRPSVLANPPLSAAAIAQRHAAVEALGAYAVAAAAVASGAPPADTAIARADAQRAAIALSAAARRHAQGDLVIEDSAAAFAVAVDRFAAAGGTAQTQQAVRDGSPAFAKLAATLRNDVARAAIEASNAAGLAYDRWLAVDRAVRAAPAGALPRATTLPLPRCLEPAVPSGLGTSPPEPAPSRNANDPAGAAVRARLGAARARYDAVAGANPDEALAALAALSEAAAAALAAPGDRNAAATLEGARARVLSTSQALAQAYGPLVLR